MATIGLSALFALASFLSAALVFTVEPMFAKMILPLLGGAPAVWNTCLMFFQAALLAGYGYAHLITTRFAVRQQAIAHGFFLLLASMALPVTLPSGWTPPVDSTPIVWLVLVLTLGVGAPFLMLSATAPLLQKWFSGTDHPAAKDPYFLYSASNVGSILALLAYPLVIERSWPLPQQTWIWAAAYIAFSVVMVLCAAFSVRRAAAPRMNIPADDDVCEPVVSWTQRVEWLARSFVPSSLLLGVTTYLSTDIAAVPLLWTVPLTLYLLSFVIAFARSPLVAPRLVARATPLLVSALVLFVAAGVSGPIRLLIPLHLVTFFACALHLHTALADRRPHTRHLTEFYLWIAGGGVLGGIFNTFLAPLVFTGIVEYPAALVAACLVAPWRPEVADRRLSAADVVLPLAVGALTAGLTYALSTHVLPMKVFVALVGPLAIWCFSFSRRPVRFGLALGMLLLAAQAYQPDARALVVADRTFFGVLRVRASASESRHVLMHGNTIHGEQSLEADRRGEPLTYYHRSGPIGQVMGALSSGLRNAQIGVVGLGAGSLAAYVEPGQSWTFYEIDPAVVRIAREPGLFTYLDDCGNRCTVVLGDARLSLAREGTPAYRLLVLDAFSSDAIPVHLMTKEALDLYVSRLEPDGVIAFHISNRHLRLRTVLARLAADQGLAALVRHDTRSKDAITLGQFPSEWLIMARRPELFGSLVEDPRWAPPATSPDLRIWTDHYSDILAVIRMGD